MNRSMRVGVSLFVVLAAALVAVIVVQGQPVAPVPSARNVAPAAFNPANSPYNIVILSSSPEFTSDWASPETIAAQLGAQIFSSWEDFINAQIHPLDAVIVHSSAAGFADREWLADAYWNDGIVVAAVNLDWPEFYPMLTGGHCVGTPMDPRLSHGDHVVIRSRLLVADIPAEREALAQDSFAACEGDGNVDSTVETTGFNAESIAKYQSGLNNANDLSTLRSVILSFIRSIDLEIEGFLMRTWELDATPEVFRERMLAIGLSEESVDKAVAEIWGGD